MARYAIPELYSSNCMVSGGINECLRQHPFWPRGNSTVKRHQHQRSNWRRSG